MLHEVVREAWPAFLAQAEERGGLPLFVRRDFDEYLRCGLLEHGLVRLGCEACGEPMVVGFSCKRRGFCPSCLARRMSDVSAHLIDGVLPEVPVRQWVCSFPWRVRVWLGYDRALCGQALRAFAGALERGLLRRAKRQLGLRSVTLAHTGAVTVVQRADSSLRNVHLHTLALDGVYVRRDGALVFVPLGAPSPEDVLDVARWTHARLVLALTRAGRSLDGPDDGGGDALVADQPVLASCYAASAADVQLLGAEPGARTTKLGRPVAVRARDVARPGAVAAYEGVDVHAEVAVDGRDRARLERLCRYVMRPPLSVERLSRTSDGRVKVEFKKPWKDGTDAVLLAPLDLVSRLCALVPPPRFHMSRYHGVLAAHSGLRAEVVGTLAAAPTVAEPAPETRGVVAVQLALFDRLAGGNARATAERGDADEDAGVAARPSRHPWAWLLQRVFAADVTLCARCGGRMKIVQVATSPDAIARALGQLGLGPRAPPPSRPAPAGQLTIAFEDG